MRADGRDHRGIWIAEGHVKFVARHEGGILAFGPDIDSASDQIVSVGNEFESGREAR